MPSEIIRLERDFEVVIERDEDGMYVASVPELAGCHTQAKTLNVLMDNISEAIGRYFDKMPDRLKVVWMQ